MSFVRIIPLVEPVSVLLFPTHKRSNSSPNWSNLPKPFLYSVTRPLFYHNNQSYEPRFTTLKLTVIYGYPLRNQVYRLDDLLVPFLLGVHVDLALWSCDVKESDMFRFGTGDRRRSKYHESNRRSFLSWEKRIRVKLFWKYFSLLNPLSRTQCTDRKTCVSCTNCRFRSTDLTPVIR